MGLLTGVRADFLHEIPLLRTGLRNEVKPQAHCLLGRERRRAHVTATGKTERP